MGMTNSGKAAAALFAAAGLTILASAGTTQAQPRPAGQSNVAAKRIERGKYLVTIMGCNDCHTPLKMGANGPEADMSRMLSGHPESMKLPPAPKASAPWMGVFDQTLTAYSGPWGISYAANLTPDKNTGLGIWTEDMFLKALKTGKHMATSRDIQPPMPWMWAGKATDEDLKAMFAYLQSVPAIVNHVPDYAPPAAPGQPAAPAKKGAKKG